MAKQVINLGTAPSGAGGDDRRSAWLKAIANFDELYNFLAGSANAAGLPASLAAAITAAGGYAKSNIVGAVGQAGGVPSGAVIERGSNSNGNYVRYADGTQICWHSVNVGAVDHPSLIGPLYYSAITGARPFPIAFSAVPICEMSLRSVSGGTVMMTEAAAATVSASKTLYSIAPTAGSRTLVIEYIAIGRWY